MVIFAPNPVAAKSKFWYFMRQFRKMKKTTGEILDCVELIEKNSRTVKNYGIWLRYDSRSWLDVTVVVLVLSKSSVPLPSVLVNSRGPMVLSSHRSRSSSLFPTVSIPPSVEPRLFPTVLSPLCVLLPTSVNQNLLSSKNSNAKKSQRLPCRSVFNGQPHCGIEFNSSHTLLFLCSRTRCSLVGSPRKRYIFIVMALSRMHLHTCCSSSSDRCFVIDNQPL